MKTRTGAGTSRSAGITLTEILISILILGVGLVSLATLFPIGLLRLREAQRQTRSAYLFQSATADVAARGLLSSNSFVYADFANLNPPGYPMWFLSRLNPDGSGRYNPLTQDTAFYGDDPYDPANPGVPYDPANPNNSGGYGLPFAYDPLWRYQTGYYLDPSGQSTPEARFGAGSFVTTTTSTSLLRPDPSPGGGLASAHGLQRLTNFNRPAVMPSAMMVPSTFVSPEDVVWQESTNPNYTVAFLGGAVGTPSTVVPDLSIAQNSLGQPTYQPTNDWRFSWMITAQQNNSANGAAFEGNIVVFENRPFSVDNGVVAGETVVEAVFGASSNVSFYTTPTTPPYTYSEGYSTGADRAVLLRWYAIYPDPVVKVGDFIADVTYERNQNTVISRFLVLPQRQRRDRRRPNAAEQWRMGQPAGAALLLVPGAEGEPGPVRPVVCATFRSMTVYVNRPLDAKTLLDGNGNPVVLNAALICPYVVNVIPQTFFVR